MSQSEVCRDVAQPAGNEPGEPQQQQQQQQYADRCTAGGWQRPLIFFPAIEGRTLWYRMVKDRWLCRYEFSFSCDRLGGAAARRCWHPSNAMRQHQSMQPVPGAQVH